MHLESSTMPDFEFVTFWVGLGFFLLFLLSEIMCHLAFPEFELLDAWYLEYLNSGDLK